MIRRMAHLVWSLLLALVLASYLSLETSADNSTTTSASIASDPVPYKNETVQFKVRGLIPAVFTAFNDDYTINYDVIPAYAKYLVDSGFKGVLVGGSTGQHTALPVEDRKKLIDAWLKVGRSVGLQILVQVGGAAFPDVIELAKHSEAAGLDGLLTLPELYFRPTTVVELVSYVEEVANAAPNTPILYYHIPHSSNVALNMPAFVEAASARIPNFKGIKFTSRDLGEAGQVLRKLRGDQEFFLGGDTLLAPAALLGVRSCISPTSTLFPRQSLQILQAVENNDVEKARSLQELINTAVEAHVAEGAWIPVIRAGMEIMTGLKMGPPARPQKPISAEAKQRIYTKLRALRLIE